MNDKELQAFLLTAPQEVRNTVAAWSRLNVMAQDRNTYPSLAAEIREARVLNERDAWRDAAEQGPQEKPE